MNSDMSSIVRAGLLAPSADNRHSFRIRAALDELHVFGGDAYAGAPYHRRILHLISFGAVVENMVIRASRLGYRPSADFLPDASDPLLIARLRLRGGEAGPGSLDAAIGLRHTNRRLAFSGPRLAPEELVQFGEALQDIEGVSMNFLDSAPRRGKLLRLVRIAEAERFNTRALHHDLFSSVRFDVGWRASAEEGLPPGALGVEPGLRWAFAQLRRWPVMNALRRMGVHHALGFRAGDLPCRLSPHCGVLTTSLPVERGALLVGRALQRTWLRAASTGLAFQPLAGAALLAMPGYTDVPAALRERLREGWRVLTDETPLMVFRLGRAAPPLVRAGRPQDAAQYLQK